MGSKAVSSASSSRKSLDIRSVLATAVLEWLLILMLLVNAIFSYLISTFAHYCGLPAPCPLCSRLDHILGSKKLKYYWDMVCRDHKLEISSLGLCHAHNTLVDVHGMCEACLFSFATTNKSNAETYRLLVGKLGEDSGFGPHDEDSSSTGERCSKVRNCSCCNEPWMSIGTGKKLVKLKSMVSVDADVNVPSSSGVDPLAHIEDNADSHVESESWFSAHKVGASGSVHEIHPVMEDDSIECSMEPHFSSVAENFTSDPLAHVEYSELNADSDAEYNKARDDAVQKVGASCLIHETHPLMVDDSVEYEPTEPHISSLPEHSSLDPLAHVGYIGVKVDSDAKSEDRVSEEEGDVNTAVHETHPLMRDDGLECVTREPYAACLVEDSILDPAAVAGYVAVKVCSDAESEDQVSDEENDADVAAHETDPLMEAVAPERVSSELDAVNVPETETLEKLEDQVSVTEPSVLVSKTLSDRLTVPDVTTSATSLVADSHDFEELSWKHAEKAEPSPLPELICLDEDLSPSVAEEEDKFISPEDVPPQLNDRDIVEETLSKESHFISTEKDATETAVEPLDDESPTSDTASCLHLELTKGSKLNEDDDAGLSSPEEVETPVEGLKENSDRRREEMWEPSAAETEEEEPAAAASATSAETSSETNQVSNDISPQWHNLLDLGDAYKLAVGNKGRHLSGLLSEQWLGKDSSRLSEDLKNLALQLDGSPRVSSMSPRVPMSPKLSINSEDLTGVQMLQKRMSLERNESGLSVDGTLVSEIEGESLVDRLKRQVDHDKKLLNVLYKELEEERNASAVAANQAMAMITRLQEEKAAFQMEAQQCLRVMEDQAEYDMEVLQKMNDLLVEKAKEIQDLEAELEFYRNTFHPDVETAAADIRVDGERNGGRVLSEVNKSFLGLEDERSYISTRLKKLEEKLHMLSNGGNCIEMEDELQEQNGSVGKPTSASMGIESLADEVTDLNERLGTLEADRNFLERSINSMRNGEEGIRLIHEIASDLRELRSIGIRRRD